MTDKKAVLEDPYFRLLGGGVIVIWVISIFIMSIFSGGETPKAGQMGDMFGAVNSLFSGLAFATLAYTLHQQNKQVELLVEQNQDSRLQTEMTTSEYFIKTLEEKIRTAHSLLLIDHRGVIAHPSYTELMNLPVGPLTNIVNHWTVRIQEATSINPHPDSNWQLRDAILNRDIWRRIMGMKEMIDETHNRFLYLREQWMKAKLKPHS